MKIRVRVQSVVTFCCGYLLLLSCLAVFPTPYIGVGLSLLIESIAAGYYLHVMQVEIHETPAMSLAQWPILDIKGLSRLLRLGMFTNVIQFAYAAMAIAFCLPLFLVICLTVHLAKAQANFSDLTQLFAAAAVLTLPFSLWMIIVMAPVALARYAHSGIIKDAFDFESIARSIVWSSGLIKGSATIYFAAILLNSTLMTVCPRLMNIVEPLVEFTSMAFVCRLTARWYRQVTQDEMALEVADKALTT